MPTLEIRKMTRLWSGMLAVALALSPAGSALRLSHSVQAAPLPSTAYVEPLGLCGGNSPCYTSIQAAVNDVIADGTIKVAAGTYTETVATEVAYIDHALTLSGGWDVTFSLVIGISTIDAGTMAGQRGIYVDLGAAVTVINFTIQNADLTPNEVGGGIRIADGSVYLSNTTITSNQANLGGGVYIDSGSLTMDSGSISMNAAVGYGGGVYVFDGGTVNLAGGTINGNAASNGGGVFLGGSTSLTQTGGAIDGNSADFGAGVYVYGGTITMDGGEIATNAAAFDGGGVFVDNNGSITVNGGNLVGNSAIDGAGLFVYIGSGTLRAGSVSGNAANYGGGVYVYDANATFSMEGGTIDNNNAAWDGGGLYNYASYASINGGQITSNTAYAGAGIYVDTGTADLFGGQIISNSASYGGGVYSWAGNANLSGAEITGNTAIDGGGVYVDDAAAFLSFTAGTINGNSATTAGGGIHVAAGAAEVSSGQIGYNSATDGGGLYVGAGTATLTQAAVMSNTATTGGGIQNSGGTVSLANSTLSYNYADGSGGGLYNDAGGTANLSFSTVAMNQADADSSGGGDGGGIVNQGVSTVNLDNSILAANADGSPLVKVTDCSGILTSQSYNLIQGAADCTLTGDTTGNVTGMAALLGALQDNGGSTLTHSLLPGSPALDAGSSLCPPLPEDQRGLLRPQGGRCDMGAYEAQQFGFTTATRSVAENAGTVTITAMLSAASVHPVTVPYTVTGTATGGGTDHNLAAGNFSLSVGITQTTRNFNVTNDTLDEADETVIVTLGNPTNAVLGATRVQTITITDDDLPAQSQWWIYLPNIFKNFSTCYAGPQESEPNDLSSQANGPVCPGVTYSGASDAVGDDSDYYKIELAATGSITADLNNTVAGQPVQLQLRDQALALIDFETLEPFVVSASSLPPGTYYVRVYLPDGYGSTPYSLTMTFP